MIDSEDTNLNVVIKFSDALLVCNMKSFMFNVAIIDKDICVTLEEI